MTAGRIKMSTTDSHLKVDQINDITRIEFLDRNILDEANIQQIGEQVTSIIDSSDKVKMLIDFSNVDHLSSAALGALITINNKVKEKEGQLRLSNIAGQIYEVFVITRLNKLFEIYPTEEEALKSFD